MTIDGIYSVCITKQEFGKPQRRYGEMELRVDPENGWLKGSMFPRFFWMNSPFRKGGVEGDTFWFVCYFNTPCQQFEMKVEGRFDGEKVWGTIQDPGGSADFIGTRISGQA